MNLRTCNIVLLASALALIGGCSSRRARNGEDRFAAANGLAIGPVLTAAELLPADILRGDNYEIEPAVLIVDYYYQFNLSTPFGVVPASGMSMLELRLQEMKAISRAEKLADDPHLLEGFTSSFRDAATGLRILVTDPFGAIERAPHGLGLMIRGHLDAADRAAGSIERRRLAARLGCDPETRNPILKKLLDKMALQYGAGRLLTVPASIIPGVSVLKTTGTMDELVAEQPPHEINEQIHARLIKLNVSEETAKAFVASRAFTTRERLLMMDQVERLAGVDGMPVVLATAVDSDSEATALASIRRTRMLADLNERHPIEHLTEMGFPIARLAGGAQVIATPVDYIPWTQDVEETVSRYRASYPGVRTFLLIAGQVGPEARNALLSAQIEVVTGDSPLQSDLQPSTG